MKYENSQKALQAAAFSRRKTDQHKGHQGHEVKSKRLAFPFVSFVSFVSKHFIEMVVNVWEREFAVE